MHVKSSAFLLGEEPCVMFYNPFHLHPSAANNFKYLAQVLSLLFQLTITFKLALKAFAICSVVCKYRTNWMLYVCFRYCGKAELMPSCVIFNRSSVKPLQRRVGTTPLVAVTCRDLIRSVEQTAGCICM